GGDYSVWPRVVATVIALAPQGMATIRTADGTMYDVIKGTRWRVGDTVECEQHPRVRMPWQAFDCWKISGDGTPLACAGSSAVGSTRLTTAAAHPAAMRIRTRCIRAPFVCQPEKQAVGRAAVTSYPSPRRGIAKESRQNKLSIYVLGSMV